MNLLIVSGLSGAGKSVAMNALEDIGFFCIDNIPAALLPSITAFSKAGPPAGVFTFSLPSAGLWYIFVIVLN